MDKPPKPDEDFIGLTGAAQRLQHSASWVRDEVDAGVLPHVRNDYGRRLFRPEDVATFKREQDRN